MGTLNKLWHFFFSRQQAGIWQRGTKSNAAASAPCATFHMYNVRHFHHRNNIQWLCPTCWGVASPSPQKGNFVLFPAWRRFRSFVLWCHVAADHGYLLFKLMTLFCGPLTPLIRALILGWCYLMAQQQHPVMQTPPPNLVCLCNPDLQKPPSSTRRSPAAVKMEACGKTFKAPVVAFFFSTLQYFTVLMKGDNREQIQAERGGASRCVCVCADTRGVQIHVMELVCWWAMWGKLCHHKRLLGRQKRQNLVISE